MWDQFACTKFNILYPEADVMDTFSNNFTFCNKTVFMLFCFVFAVQIATGEIANNILFNILTYEETVNEELICLSYKLIKSLPQIAANTCVQQQKPMNKRREKNIFQTEKSSVFSGFTVE